MPLLFLLGCRYQTGFPLEKGTSVAISVENKSTAPQLGPILNRKIKEELLKAGVHSISKNPQKSSSSGEGLSRKLQPDCKGLPNE